MIQKRQPTEKTLGFPGDFCENFHDFDENALEPLFKIDIDEGEGGKIMASSLNARKNI